VASYLLHTVTYARRTGDRERERRKTKKSRPRIIMMPRTLSLPLTKMIISMQWSLNYMAGGSFEAPSSLEQRGFCLVATAVVITLGVLDFQAVASESVPMK
jgi:hypothetical protein